ncbi:MAG TPA: hypothetical protein VFQ84_09420 [Arenimonas sp.]|uniref:hypothetical protein n=1 Tax=Arenimonas sp. TaxID=1872635 RepID=UPI002D7FC2F0|nr:hypothetical protein [Arenimonas sp.]HEU0153551.1 hypothetical protein [Arenimonas sp.]
MILRPALLVLALLALSFTAAAAEPDPVVKAQLESKGTPFEIDDDGDFQIVVRLDDDRTQLVWVRTVTSETTHHKVREIWSPGYQSATDNFPASVANDLLARSQEMILGAWVKQDRVAMFVTKIDADADADTLDEAIDLTALAADEVEKDLTGKDDL